MVKSHCCTRSSADSVTVCWSTTKWFLDTIYKGGFIEPENSDYVFGKFMLDSAGGSRRGLEESCFWRVVQENPTLVKLGINLLHDPAVVNKQDPGIGFQEARSRKERSLDSCSIRALIGWEDPSALKLSAKRASFVTPLRLLSGFTQPQRNFACVSC